MLVRHVLSQLSYAPFVSLLRCSPQRRGSLYTLAPVLSTPFFRKNPSFFRRLFSAPKPSLRLTDFPENAILRTNGELSERFKEPVLKTGDGETHREFESHTLRHKSTVILIELRWAFSIPENRLESGFSAVRAHKRTPLQAILRRGFVRFRRIVAFCAVVIVKKPSIR